MFIAVSGFHESLNSPLTPFNPTKKPDQGILKTPVSDSQPVTPTSSINRTPPSPRSQQIINKVKAKRQGQATPIGQVKIVSTPVLAVGRRPTPMKKRATAADFFL